MVQSKINRKIQYQETKRIFAKDENKELDVYEYSLFGMPVSICIGNVSTKYLENHIYIFPIYLVKKNGKVVQIGLFEISSLKYRYYVSADNEVDLNKMPPPLLYSFATIEYISSVINGVDHIREVSDKVAIAQLEQHKEQQKIEHEKIILNEPQKIQSQMDFISLVPQYSKTKSRKQKYRLF